MIIFEYRKLESGGIQITKCYISDRTEVVIPETIEGEDVIAESDICNRHFAVFYFILKLCCSVRYTCVGEVQITGTKNGFKRIFEKCGGLTDIIIPDSVVTIDSYAFTQCNGLTKMTIPAGVKLQYDSL